MWWASECWKKNIDQDPPQFFISSPTKIQIRWNEKGYYKVDVVNSFPLQNKNQVQL